MPMWNRIVVMDGAMGSQLRNPSSEDSYCVTKPEIVEDLHREYLKAGADIIKTNTFMSNRGPQDYEINVAGARIACKVAAEFSPPRFVAGAIGPGGTSESGYFQQACGLIEGGAHLLLAETMTSIGNANMAIQACEQALQEIGRDLPIMISITIAQDGKLLSGESPDMFCKSMASHRLFSLGINCSFGARHMRPHIKNFSEIAGTLVSCHPSAGLPDASGKYPESPEEWADIVREFAERGWADIVGGCCGTTPDHIRALSQSARQIPHATIDLL
jgi:5-methyltetrahydrofolate--homocysteine methyltransferase